MPLEEVPVFFSAVGGVSLMNSFRFSVAAASIALMVSLGSSASTATTNYSHPAFSVADDRTLNLRETGSKIVVETVEDALRQGGVSLLGDGFQLDSSLNYVFGETIEGELDVVVPLWSRGGHVVFTQPGLIFWQGIEEEKRIDGNLGVVYRAPIGFKAIGGVSLFYDHDFQVGHSRISLGADIQRGYLHGSANYYQPLSDEQDGRTGYIEDAIRGMDARLVYERRKIRLSGNLGFWRYEGDGDSNWELSYGLDAGVRIMRGVFVEAGYEKHDDASIEDRLNLGVALKFSLPDFEGKSYGDGSMSSNLYKVVEREKRILYEERESHGIFLLPTVNLSTDSTSIREGNTATITLTLSEALGSDATFNLVGSSESNDVTYGASNDWNLSVGGTDCDMATESDPCQVTIMQGQTTAEVTVEINTDTIDETSSKDFTVSVAVDSGSMSIVQPGSDSSLNFTIPADLPNVSMNYAGNTMNIGSLGTVRMTIELSEALSEPITLHIVGDGSTADYGASDAGGKWQLARMAVPAGGTSSQDDLTSICTDIEGNRCSVTLDAGATIVDVDVFPGSSGTSGETVMISVVIPSESNRLVKLGNTPMVTLTF